MGLRDSCNMYMWSLCPFSDQGHSAYLSKIASNLKLGGRRAKLN